MPVVRPCMPTWFLSAVAAAGLPDDAPPEQVAGRLADARQLLDWLRAQAQQLFVREGNAAAAWATLEAGLLEVCAPFAGTVPWHGSSEPLSAGLLAATMIGWSKVDPLSSALARVHGRAKPWIGQR